MKENVIVSLADSNYFELLNELIDSIKSFDENNNVALCILDAGLKENQVDILSKKVDKIKKANWDIKVSSFKVMARTLPLQKIDLHLYIRTTKFLIGQSSDQRYPCPSILGSKMHNCPASGACWLTQC